jgi:hypothetical protein
MAAFVWKPAHSLPDAVIFTTEYPSTVVSIQLELDVAFLLGYMDIFPKTRMNN